MVASLVHTAACCLSCGMLNVTTRARQFILFVRRDASKERSIPAPSLLSPCRPSQDSTNCSQPAIFGRIAYAATNVQPSQASVRYFSATPRRFVFTRRRSSPRGAVNAQRRVTTVPGIQNRTHRGKSDKTKAENARGGAPYAKHERGSISLHRCRHRVERQTLSWFIHLPESRKTRTSLLKRSNV